MSIVDIFSKRQKRNSGEIDNVLIYDQLPDRLKIQIVQIWNEIDAELNNSGELFEHTIKILRKEYGQLSLLHLTDEPSLDKQSTPKSELEWYFLFKDSIEKNLDVIEVSFGYKHELIKINPYWAIEILNPAIDELNARFLEHNVGYKFDSGMMIKIGSTFIQTEIVDRTLKLLHKQDFNVAQQEFLQAHRHYRNQDYKAAINECSNAFESVMKVICERRNWSTKKNPTTGVLVDTCIQRGLVPNIWQNHLSCLAKLLKSGVPPARNNLSAHGQGVEITSVPDYLVSFVLNLTATCIVFLIDADENYQ